MKTNGINQRWPNVIDYERDLKVKITKKTAGLRRGNSSESYSAWSKIVCCVKISQFSEVINEN